MIFWPFGEIPGFWVSIVGRDTKIVDCGDMKEMTELIVQKAVVLESRQIIVECCLFCSCRQSFQSNKILNRQKISVRKICWKWIQLPHAGMWTWQYWSNESADQRRSTTWCTWSLRWTNFLPYLDTMRKPIFYERVKEGFPTPSWSSDFDIFP